MKHLLGKLLHFLDRLFWKLLVKITPPDPTDPFNKKSWDYADAWEIVHELVERIKAESGGEISGSQEILDALWEVVVDECPQILTLSQHDQDLLRERIKSKLMS